jgi:hypothetical protein
LCHFYGCAVGDGHVMGIAYEALHSLAGLMSHF